MRGIFVILVIFLSIVVVSASSLVDSEEECGDYHYLLPEKAMVIEETSGFPGSNAHDGDIETYWITDYFEQFSRYIDFDLGKKACVDSVDVFVGRHYPAISFDVLVSEDLLSWERVIDDWKIKRGGMYHSIDFDEKRIRYIRLDYDGSLENPFFVNELRVNAAQIGSDFLGLDFASRPIEPFCEDLDGVDYFTKGELNSSNYPREGYTIHEDGCWSESILYENVCVGDRRSIEAYRCPYGHSCMNGACVSVLPEVKDCSSCIEISEWNYDAEGDDCENPNGEFVEFSNSCSRSCSLDKWKLRDQIGHEYNFTDYTLSGMSELRLFSGSGDDTSEELFWENHGSYDVCSAIWNNNGDELFLYDSSGDLVLRDRFFVLG